MHFLAVSTSIYMYVESEFGKKGDLKQSACWPCVRGSNSYLGSPPTIWDFFADLPFWLILKRMLLVNHPHNFSDSKKWNSVLSKTCSSHFSNLWICKALLLNVGKIVHLFPRSSFKVQQSRFTCCRAHKMFECFANRSLFVKFKWDCTFQIKFLSSLGNFQQYSAPALYDLLPYTEKIQAE